MSKLARKLGFCVVLCFFPWMGSALASVAYNNFGSGNEGFEYSTSESWMIAGFNSYFQYVEQAHAFTPNVSGYMSDIYIGLMEVLGVNECTVRLVPDTGEPPSEEDALETWFLHDGDLPSGGGGEPRPATHLVSVIHPYLTAGQTYWIWVMVDQGSSASWGQNVTGSMGHMKQFVWVDEHYQYEWVDMGDQIIGALRIDILDSSTPTITPTPTATDTPTVTPTATATPTGAPPSPTPTATATPTGAPPSPTPTNTYTPWPTNTPTPTPQVPTNTPAIPTNTPTAGCEELSVNIVMPSNYFVEGDPFSTYVDICNPGPEQYTNILLFVILDVHGQLYFAPDFNDFAFFAFNSLDIGMRQVEVVPEFTWPGNVSESSGIWWYAGMTDAQVTMLLGLMDTYEFGWGY